MASVDLNKVYDCEKCKRGLMMKRNCLGDQEKPDRTPILPAVPWMYTRRCPRALVEDNPKALILWDDYTTWRLLNSMPYEGGTYNQPNEFIETIKFLAVLMSKIENDKDFIDWSEKRNKKNSYDKEDNKLRSFRDVANRRPPRKPLRKSNA